jgi:hypothetical protein
MSPPRFRLRTLLVAVAVAAVAMGAMLMLQRAAAYRRLAERHAERERMHRDSAALATAEAEDLAERGSADGAALWRERVDDNAAKAARSAELSRKYLHAAAHPWLAVEPDPPPPE